MMGEQLFYTGTWIDDERGALSGPLSSRGWTRRHRRDAYKFCRVSSWVVSPAQEKRPSRARISSKTLILSDFIEFPTVGMALAQVQSLMEALTVDEDVEKNYMPSQWSQGLRGVARMQRYLHLCEIQDKHNNLTQPIEHVSYGADERQGLNIMRCETGEEVHVFVHGGFWLEGDRHMHNFISHGLHLHNISVVTLGYRLAAPGSGLDHCVEDVVKGIEKVQELFPENSISVSGHSAGGHLVMMAIPRLSSLRGIRKVFCVSGIYFIQDVANTSVGVQIGFNSEQVEKFTASPHPCYDQVELHLIVGQHDPPSFRKQAERFANRMVRKRFRKREVLVIPGEDHFSIVENLFYEKSPLTLCFAGLYEAKKKRSKL